jgi:hypothetical protein
MISIKIHRTYRTVVAICDSDLIGKKFEEGIRQLDLRENFYKEKESSQDEAIKLIKKEALEDATFNIVGKESIQAAVKAGLINEKDVGKIKGIPLILTLS